MASNSSSVHAFQALDEPRTAPVITISIYNDLDIIHVANQNHPERGGLLIDRLQLIPAKAGFKPPPKHTVSRVVTANALLGVFRLKAGAYLIAVTDCCLVATVNSLGIFGITNVELIPFSPPDMDPSLARSEKTLEQINMVEKFLSSTGFYFADGAENPDVKISLFAYTQRSFGARARVKEWGPMDKRFFWNAHLVHDFRVQGMESWVTPILQGSVHLMRTTVEGKMVSILLISRRNVLRPGMRTHARGLDRIGNTANFVETEQILIMDGRISSFVVTRGSCPVFWHQKSYSLATKASITEQPEDTLPALLLHIQEQNKVYLATHLVNLLEDKGDEKMLKSTLEACLDLLKEDSCKESNYFYTSIDVNALTKGLNYSQIAEFVVRTLKNPIEDMTFFMIVQTDPGGPMATASKQTGVFRVNCQDCLNRTNLVQSTICRHHLQSVLGDLGLLTDQFGNLPQDMDYEYRGIWAAMGDNISRQYSGGPGQSSIYMPPTSTSYKDVFKSTKRALVKMYYEASSTQSQDSLELFVGKPEEMGMLWTVDVADRILQVKREEWSHTTPLRVFIGSWNINGGKDTPQDLNMWLQPALEHHASLIVIGFQEFVDLTASNVMLGGDDKKIRRVKSDDNSSAADDPNRVQIWENLVAKSLGSSYKKLAPSRQLVGLLLVVFGNSNVDSEMVGTAEMDVVKVGFGGIAGNKGAVACQLQIADSKILFVNTHLAAGQKHIAARNSDYNDITKSLMIRNVGLLDHDIVFWFGDLNYRIEFPFEQCCSLVTEQNFKMLQSKDQLLAQRREGASFQGYEEGPLDFAPTYKYDFNSTVYDTSEKHRSPAWCDRMMWRGRDVTQLNYNRIEMLNSDHRPIYGLFDAFIRHANRNAKEKMKVALLASCKKAFAGEDRLSCAAQLLTRFLREQQQQQGDDSSPISTPTSTNSASITTTTTTNLTSTTPTAATPVSTPTPAAATAAATSTTSTSTKKPPEPAVGDLLSFDDPPPSSSSSAASTATTVPKQQEPPKKSSNELSDLELLMAGGSTPLVTPTQPGATAPAPVTATTGFASDPWATFGSTPTTLQTPIATVTTPPRSAQPSITMQPAMTTTPPRPAMQQQQQHGFDSMGFGTSSFGKTSRDDPFAELVGGSSASSSATASPVVSNVPLQQQQPRPQFMSPMMGMGGGPGSNMMGMGMGMQPQGNMMGMGMGMGMQPQGMRPAMMMPMMGLQQPIPPQQPSQPQQQPSSQPQQQPSQPSQQKSNDAFATLKW